MKRPFLGAKFTCHNRFQKLVGLLVAENFVIFHFCVTPPFFCPPGLAPTHPSSRVEFPELRVRARVVAID
jgi:hypothetical protein